MLTDPICETRNTRKKTQYTKNARIMEPRDIFLTETHLLNGHSGRENAFIC